MKLSINAPKNQSPQRIISLVPSLTATCFDLGVGPRLVGCTDYCQLSADSPDLPRLGGTKNPKRREILALKPDLILFNKEENRRVDIAWLQDQGLALFDSFPRSPLQAMTDIESLMHRLNIADDNNFMRVQELRTRIAALIARPQPQRPPTFFVAIWKSPWMTANGDTYVSSLLETSGAVNVFGERQRRFPLAFELGLSGEEDPPDQQDTRYPRLSIEELAIARPDIIILPNEPFPFGPAHVEEILANPTLADIPAVRNRRVHLLDGRLLTWHSLGWIEKAIASLEKGELATFRNSLRMGRG